MIKTIDGEKTTTPDFFKCVICGCRRKADTKKGTFFRGHYVCEKCLTFIRSTDFGGDRDDVTI